MNKGKLVPMLLLCLLMTSCWDSLDIERNAFVLGIAIDSSKNEENIQVTFQVALTDAFGLESSETEGTLNITVESDNVFNASSALKKMLDRNPAFQHCQVLLFGEEYARKGIRESLDFFFRDPEVRSQTSVAVVEKEAKAALEFKSKTAKASAMHIAYIMDQNSYENLEVTSYNNIGGVYQNYIQKSPITLSRIVVDKDRIDISGAAVLGSDYKLVGWYDGKEVEGIRWIRGDFKKGVITIDASEQLGDRVTLEIFAADSTMRPELIGDRLVVRNRIKVEGDIVQIKNPAGKIHSDFYIEKWQKGFQDYIENRVKRSFLKARDEFQVDTLELDRKMANYYSNYWAKNRENWDEIFRKAELDVEAEVKIRRIGDIN